MVFTSFGLRVVYTWYWVAKNSDTKLIVLMTQESAGRDWSDCTSNEMKK